MTPQYFKFKGKVYLWKYLENQSNYPGINLTANRDGCDSMIELLTLLGYSQYAPTKTLNLQPTIQQIASVGTRKDKFKSFTALTLHFATEEESTWTVEELNDEIRLSFSLHYLNELKNAINRIREGAGDFLLTDNKRKNILCFWWYPNG